MQEKLTQIKDNFSAMPFNKKALLGTALAVGIGITATSIALIGRPNYVTMMSGIEPESLQTIIPLLEAEGIAFSVNQLTSSLLVDADSIAQAQIVLAKNGLPAASASGYDHLNSSNSPYVTKSTEEQLSRQILEENIEGSILQLQAVKSVAVRLAMAKNSQFLRDVEPASASVVITFKRGQSLRPEQIQGIVRMIAFSVPNLPEENVVILDSTGRTLSRGGDSVLGTNGTAAEFKFSTEETLREKIIKVVQPIVGEVRVNVASTINFDKVENTTESPVTNTVVLSHQVEKSYDLQLSGGGGVVGAVANQPPGQAQFAATPQTTEVNSESGVSHSKETTNFSVGKSITHTIKSVGEIERLDVAILFDRTQFTEEELPTIINAVSSLAMSSIGFDTERGDSLDVQALIFAEVVEEEAEVLPIYETKLAKEALEALKYFSGLFMLWLLFWRPLMKALMGSAKEVSGEEDALPVVALAPDLMPNELPRGVSSLTEATEAEFEAEKEKAVEILNSLPVEAQSVLQSWLDEISLEDLMKSKDSEHENQDNDDTAQANAEGEQVAEHEK